MQSGGISDLGWNSVQFKLGMAQCRILYSKKTAVGFWFWMELGRNSTVGHLFFGCWVDLDGTSCFVELGRTIDLGSIGGIFFVGKCWVDFDLG